MKAAHGFRKYYKTHAEQVMRPINVEVTMGHNLGVSKSYWKPTENDVLQDYLKAAPNLMISYEQSLLNQSRLMLEKNELLQKERNELEVLRQELAPLLALKDTLLREGILKES